ncbi:sulfur carrier protein ThiS [Micromonospora sp. WMMD1120]|uniref:sulfur carrier protein ThiS n=1 Tax=Micromonospora sp. WMMD1120 TaxID=3016106 RepID=UPI002416467E|nr:sulfur carrier protein ThiS [Micromonospora sp. WMMD1120]MDG4806239.1 sulfur carrier protein ThiS [Micromonospora sp. WMMD1120]
MELTVNGTGRSVATDVSVADLVGEIVPHPRGVAVAVNGEVVPRADWPTRALRDGDRVEVLTAAQGG